MNSITQDMNYRLSLIKYSLKHGVTKAAIKYRTNRQYIYRWRNRLFPRTSMRPYRHIFSLFEYNINNVNRRLLYE